MDDVRTPVAVNGHTVAVSGVDSSFGGRPHGRCERCGLIQSMDGRDVESDGRRPDSCGCGRPHGRCERCGLQVPVDARACQCGGQCADSQFGDVRVGGVGGVDTLRLWTDSRDVIWTDRTGRGSAQSAGVSACELCGGQL